MYKRQTVDIGAQIAWLLEDENDSIPDAEQSTKPVTRAEPDKVQKEEVTLKHDEITLEVKSAPLEMGKGLGLNATSTPAARARARELGVDINNIALNRKVRDADVVEYATKSTHSQSKSKPVTCTKDISSMQYVIADRMSRSKQEVPHFYMEAEMEVTKLLSLKAELASSLKTTITHWLILAVAHSMKDVPSVLRQWVDGKVCEYSSIDISVAVDIEDGLITPVIRQVDTKSLHSVGEELAELAEKARNRKLKPEEYTGGAITISNMGAWGVSRIFPIINQPQSAIIGVASLCKQVHLQDGELRDRQILPISISGDHRVLNGTDAARFLKHMKQYVENPLALLAKMGRQ